MVSLNSNDPISQLAVQLPQDALEPHQKSRGDPAALSSVIARGNASSSATLSLS